MALLCSASQILTPSILPCTMCSFYPTGQLSFHPTILYQTVEEGAPRCGRERIYVSMGEFHCYHLFIRAPDVESNHFFLTGNLYQEYVCEIWAISEQNRLNFIRLNQDKLRTDVYSGIVDAVAANADADWSQLGTRFILPSSFSGSTHVTISDLALFSFFYTTWCLRCHLHG